MKTEKDVKVFIIQEKNKYTYKLKENSGNVVTLVLEFIDIENEPKENDYIFIKEELLDPHYEGYSESYTFGDMKSKYGKENLDLDDIDVIKIQVNGKEKYLKRLYG